MLLYINWDGFSYDWYEMARKTGAGTPNLDRLISEGAILKRHYCGIPAITNPMQQTLVSGAWPEKTGNCYAYFDKEARCVKQTARRNDCENIVEAAQKRGLRCASVHGWYFENRGCAEGDAERPYIQNCLPNFETRVELLLSYLRGEAVPSGSALIKMERRPDFLAIYADDIDSTCHNGRRLSYPQLTRAKTLEEWYANLVYTVQRMDQALGKLMALPDTTIALAADHGGMPFGVAAFGETRENARKGKLPELENAVERAGIALYTLCGYDDSPDESAEAVLLPGGTQAQITYLKQIDAARQERAIQNIRALPFVRACLDKEEQKAYGAYRAFGDVYAAAKPPYYFGPFEAEEFVGGSHAAMEESVLHVFCAFYGKGIKRGVQVTEKTALTDFAPTVCALLGFDGPKDKTGRVLRELMNN